MKTMSVDTYIEYKGVFPLLWTDKYSKRLYVDTFIEFNFRLWMLI